LDEAKKNIPDKFNGLEHAAKKQARQNSKRRRNHDL